MPYTLKDEDYLTLWQHFQDKATDVKGAMFNTITWVIGFAAALLGFIFSKLTDFDSEKAEISLSALLIGASTAGLVICLYAFFAIAESAKHITSNWHYADRCLAKIDALHVIIVSKQDSSIMKIWNQLRIIVILFFAAFLAILIWGFLLPEETGL